MASGGRSPSLVVSPAADSARVLDIIAVFG
jgi:hypothetical protein